MIFLYSHNIHTMFYDASNNIHLIYMWCSITYLVMLYGVFSDIHLIYMWYSIVYWYFNIFEEYSSDIFFVIMFSHYALL